MFIVSISHARAVSVLLGGSGVYQPVPPANRDVGVLLSPRTPQTHQDVAGAICADSVDSQWQGHRHD